jgi:hypothetical protein
MTGAQLIHLVGATKRTKKGRRDRISVSEPRAKVWAARHQAVLREAFAHPGREVDLTEGMRATELEALGLHCIEGLNDEERWTSPLGDDHMALLILGLASVDTARQRREAEALMHGTIGIFP